MTGSWVRRLRAASAASASSFRTRTPACWAVARRYLSAESIAKAFAGRVDEPEEVMAIAAAT